MTQSSLELAITYRKAGFSLIPVGSMKRPAFELLPLNGEGNPSWDEFKTRQPSLNELMRYFADGEKYGIGLVQGKISGNSEVLDFETVEVYDQWYELVQEQGLHSYVDQLPMVKSPNGIHLYYRLDECLGGGTALARKNNESKDLLIETRADGHYVLAPGSPAHCHEDNKTYELLRGSLEDVPVIHEEVRNELLDLARSFDEIPTTPMYTFRGSIKTGSRPGEDFDQKQDWYSLLTDAGWKLKKQNGERSTWIKPGSESESHHATLGYCKRESDGLPLFYVFSSKAHPFDVRAYSPWEFYAVSNHHSNGKTDFNAAAKALHSRGFGKQDKAGRFKAGQKEEAANEDDDWNSPDNWGEIMPFEDSQVDYIDPRLLPTWIAEYVAALAGYTQTPTGLGVLISLSVLATCLQKKFVVAPNAGSYREPINLWTMTILPPGNRKTAVVEALRKPIQLWEQKEYLRLKDLIEDTKTAIDIAEKRIEELKRKAAKEDDVSVVRQYKEEIKQIREGMPNAVKVPDLVGTDITPEALQTAYAENQGKYSILTDEGAVLDILGGLYNNGKANLDPFLQGHAGGMIKVRRQSRQVNLANIALSIGVAIQPEAATDASGGKKIFRGKGLLARFLFCVPDSLVGRRDEISERAIDERVANYYRQRIINLLDYRPEVDENNEIIPIVLRLTAKANELYKSFKQELENKLGPGKELEAITDWVSKLPGAMLRISGLIHIAEYGTEQHQINDDVVSKSISLCKALISHAQKTLGALAIDASIEDAKFLVDRIKLICEKHPETDVFYVRRRSLQKLGRFNSSRPDRFSKALEIIQERNYISQALNRPIETKNVKLFLVNPEVFE